MNSYKTVIAESSVSRIYQHIEEPGRSFGVVSAFRADNSGEENKRLHAEMKAAVREMGLGFIEMRGGYKGDQGFVTELSLFIPSISRKQIVDLGKKYNQHSIIFKDAKEFSLVGTNESAGIGKTLSSFKFGSGKENIVLAQEAMKDFFSSLLKGSDRGKKFLFRMEEKEVWGFFQHAYAPKGVEPKWNVIYEEME